jgi:hypothetical protein
MTLNINYEQLIKDSLKIAIKELLKSVAIKGRPGNHHFFISFITNFPGVQIAEWMIKDYPNDMTIVIQNWFEDLQVDDQYFSVVLNFKNKPEKMKIPFASIISFSDPSVNFSLQFENSIKQNLEPLTDSKENNSISKSSNDDFHAKEKNNVIQFEKFKK